jgi:hypothetical protein
MYYIFANLNVYNFISNYFLEKKYKKINLKRRNQLEEIISSSSDRSEVLGVLSCLVENPQHHLF